MTGQCGKNIFATILTVLISLPLATAASRNEKTLKDLKLADFAQLSGKFQQVKHLKELDVDIKTEGHFQVLKQRSKAFVFHWNISKPKPSNICIDPIGILMESADGDPAQKKDLKFSQVGPEMGDQISSLLKIITMDQNKIGEEYNIEQKGKTLVLSPKVTQTAFFRSVNLDVNGSGLVQNVIIQEKSGDEIQIHFSALKAQTTPAMKDEQCPR